MKATVSHSAQLAKAGQDRAAAPRRPTGPTAQAYPAKAQAGAATPQAIAGSPRQVAQRQAHAYVLERKAAASEHLAGSPADLVQRQVGAPVVQLTRWEWDGHTWANVGASSTDTDEHSDPEDHEFEDEPEPGDHYDQQTGEHIRRQQDARERMARSTARQALRTEDEDYTKRGHDTGNLDFTNISNRHGNRVVDETPYGPMRHGRGRFNAQPYGTLAPEDWGDDESEAPKATGKKRKRAAKKKPSSILSNYDELAGILSDSEHKDEILEESLAHQSTTDAVVPTALPLSRRERQAATSINSLLSVAESNQSRNPTGGKVERAALRRAQQVGFRQVFNRYDGEYVPAHATVAGAAAGGTGAFREMRSGNQQLPLGTLDMLDEMSSSSEEEESSSSGSSSSESEESSSSESEESSSSSESEEEDESGSGESESEEESSSSSESESEKAPPKKKKKTVV